MSRIKRVIPIPRPSLGTLEDLEAALGQPLPVYLDEWARQALALVRDQAEYEVLQLTMRLEQDAKALGEASAARVKPRVRDVVADRATPGGFALEWVEYRFAHRAGKTLYHTRVIPRGEGDRYPSSAFRGLLRDWQRPIVTEAERELGRIRRIVRKIAAVRTAYRDLAREWAEYMEAEETPARPAVPGTSIPEPLPAPRADHDAALAREGIVERPRAQKKASAPAPAKPASGVPKQAPAKPPKAARPAQPPAAPRPSATPARPPAPAPTQAPQEKPRPKAYRDALDDHTLPDFYGDLEREGYVLPDDMRPPDL